MASYINAKVGLKIRPLFFSAPSRAAFSGYTSHDAKVQKNPKLPNKSPINSNKFHQKKSANINCQRILLFFDLYRICLNALNRFYHSLCLISKAVFRCVTKQKDNNQYYGKKE